MIIMKNIFENSVLQQDLGAIARHASVPWGMLKGKTVLITGATGLIGSLCAKALLHANSLHTNKTKIIALVRSKEKVMQVFAAYAGRDDIEFVYADISDDIVVQDSVDYIVHAACVTQSKSFVEKPVDVFKTTLWASDKLLDFAYKKKITAMVYLSSMEVYGDCSGKEKIKEDDLGYINLLNARSSYPESKRAAETLCHAYFSQYGVPVKIARLTQTFGPGVALDDNRVFALFCNSARHGDDIVMHSHGETKRNYLYTADAVVGLLKILLNGEGGQAYNLANSEIYISIREMANLVAETCATPPVDVLIDVPHDLEKKGYAPTIMLNLDTSKIEALGWCAKTDLREMYLRLNSYLAIEENNLNILK